MPKIVLSKVFKIEMFVLAIFISKIDRDNGDDKIEIYLGIVLIKWVKRFYNKQMK